MPLSVSKKSSNLDKSNSWKDFRFKKKSLRNVSETVAYLVYTLSDVLTSQECLDIILLSEKSQTFQLCTQKQTKYAAFRENYRISFNNSNLMDDLWKCCIQEPCEAWWKNLISRSNEVPSTLSSLFHLKPVGLHDHVRIYKYIPGQRFGSHHDDHSNDSKGRKSLFTLLIYLNGGEDEKEHPILGGETIFHLSKKKFVAVQPQRGMALFHAQGPSCLLHEGQAVRRGCKYILRSDIIFE